MYSGVPDHWKGVAIALSADADAAWRAAGSDFDPVSKRLLRIKLKIHSGHVSIIAVYAPTNETSKEDESEQFYLDLQEFVCKVPKRDMLLIMGDFNARVGNDVEAQHGTIGRFSPDDRNDNGERLLDFCALNNLVVTNTMFQHRPCHQQTWFHPVEKDGRGHMMDYVLVNRPFRTNILDTRVYRKTFLQSDHMLVVANVRFKLKTRRSQSQIKLRYLMREMKLESCYISEYQQLLEEALNCSVASDDPEELWGELKKAVIAARQVFVFPSDKPESDWTTDEMREISEKKARAWMRLKKFPNDPNLKVEYQRLKALAKKTAESARNAWWESKAEEAVRMYEKAVKQGRGGSLLKELRLLQRSQGSSSNTVLRAADGKGRITSTKEKLERWRQHFEQVTNVVSEVTEATLSMIPVCVYGEDLEVSDEVLIQEPSEDEVREAILQLKNNKAPGVDGITAELLKLGGEAIVEEMTRIAGSIWRSERIPEDWLMQITIPVYKKGAHDICDKFRGIALLSVPGKVLCRIIYNRLKERQS